ncbi:MAG: hypothetical protein LBV72_00540 [Tannerella sp.]|jgi:hypothetical protein|nr:hypothetical protein [Tannerella sp.]
MNMFHRRYGGIPPIATIIFHGNGGLTSNGEALISLQVPKGIVWKDVIKPEFILIGSAKQQNGFTEVRGDDGTLVVSDYMVTNNMEVYASYTVIEIGVITYAGEVISVSRWIEKYGKINDGASGIYHTEIRDSVNWLVPIEEQRKNLVRYMYWKESNDLVYGYSTGYIDRAGRNIGNSLLDSGGTSNIYNLGGSNKDMAGTDIYNYDISSITQNGGIFYPNMFIPPYAPPYNQYPGALNGIKDEFLVRMFVDDSAISGKQLTDEYYNNLVGYIDRNGVTGSPYIDYIRSWELPNIITETFFIPTLAEARKFRSHLDRIVDEIVDPLLNWADTFSFGYTIENVIYDDTYNNIYSYCEMRDSGLQPTTSGFSGVKQWYNYKDYDGATSENFVTTVINTYQSNLLYNSGPVGNTGYGQLMYDVPRDDIANWSALGRQNLFITRDRAAVNLIPLLFVNLKELF